MEYSLNITVAHIFSPDLSTLQTSKFEKKIDILFRFQIDSYLDGNLIQKKQIAAGATWA